MVRKQQNFVRYYVDLRLTNHNHPTRGFEDKQKETKIGMEEY